MNPRASKLLPRLLLGLAVVGLVRQWVWMPLIISGSSMEPTLRNGQWAGVNKLAYLFHSPVRGDVVIVCTGRDLVVKRIIGLPGEKVTASRGTFYINEQPLSEPYVELHSLLRVAPGTVEPNCFVIAGDNRSESFIGVVHRSRIIGRLTPAPKRVLQS